MSADSNDDDRRLVEAIQNKNSPDECAIIYERYTVLLHADLHRRGLKYHDAEDIAHSVMAKLLVQRFKGYRPEAGTVAAYIMQCGRNGLIDHYRRQRRQIAAVALVSDPPARSESTDHNELLERINAAIERLPESQREVLLLEQSGLRPQQIADQLGRTYPAVTMLLHRGRVELARLLDEPLPKSNRGRPRKQPMV